MATDSSPGPIVIGGNHASFPQNASWNMLDLSKLPVEATIGILSRYSAGRVNPYTVVVGEAMCRKFQLAMKGRRNLELAVNSLKVVGSIGNTLEFGFGIEDVIRSMAKSEGGSVCLAICAALKDCYSDTVAVEVLLEMARLCNVDGQYMPSSQSWKDLLKACAGTLSATNFPLRAEYLMRLPKKEQRLGAFQLLEATPKTFRGCSRPKSIAEALFALSRITRNELQAVTFIGGADAGWLATIAEWLLDLRVTMVKADGDVIFTNHSDLDNVQVHIIFRDPAEEPSQTLRCVGKTYILEDVSKLFLEEGRSPSAAVVSGRVEWKEALKSTFLSDFASLTEIPQTFAELLGSAARIFKALANAEDSFPDKYRRACTSYSDTSFGSGFVNNILQWFPELQKLKNVMQKSVSFKLKVAQKAYEFCISKIRAHCGCRTCQSKSVGFDVGEDDDLELESSSRSELDEGESRDGESDEFDTEDDWDPDKYCQVVIAETIVCLSRALANVSLENTALLPMRSGIELAYGRQLMQRRSALSGRSAIQTLGPIAFCMDFDNDFSFGAQQGNEEAVEIRLHTVVELFAGQRAPSTTADISALWANGICAFLGILRDASTDRNAVGRIHVLPGRISHEKKSYDQLVDRVLVGEAAGVDFSKAKNVITSGDFYDKRALSIRESSSALECFLELSVEAKSEDLPILVGPSRLAVMLGSRRRLVTCGLLKQHLPEKPTQYCNSDNIISTSFVPASEIRLCLQPGTHFLQISSKSIGVLRCGDNATALAALASTAYLDPTCSIYIVDKECLECGLKAALAVDRPERSHFCFLYIPTS